MGFEDFNKMYNSILKGMSNNFSFKIIKKDLRELIVLVGTFKSCDSRYNFSNNDLLEIKKLIEERKKKVQGGEKFKWRHVILKPSNFLVYLGDIWIFLNALRAFIISNNIILQFLQVLLFLTEVVVTKKLIKSSIELEKAKNNLYKEVLDDANHILEDINKKLSISNELQNTEEVTSQRKVSYPQYLLEQLIEETKSSVTEKNIFLIVLAELIKKNFNLSNENGELSIYVSLFYENLQNLSEDNLIDILNVIDDKFVIEIVRVAEQTIASLGEEDKDIREKLTSLREKLDDFSYKIELIKMANAVNMRKKEVKRELSI